MDILLEQVVYGSFPFWDRGYDVLARSPGCRADWLADVLGACQRFGEAPSGVTPAPALLRFRYRAAPGRLSASSPKEPTIGDAPAPWRFTPCWSILVTTDVPARTPSPSLEPSVATGPSGVHWTRFSGRSRLTLDRYYRPIRRPGRSSMLSPRGSGSRSNRPSRSIFGPRGLVRLARIHPPPSLISNLGIRQRQSVPPRRAPSTGGGRT